MKLKVLFSLDFVTPAFHNCSKPRSNFCQKNKLKAQFFKGSGFHPSDKNVLFQIDGYVVSCEIWKQEKSRLKSFIEYVFPVSSWTLVLVQTLSNLC